jgi:hypothetical protein
MSGQAESFRERGVAKVAFSALLSMTHMILMLVKAKSREEVPWPFHDSALLIAESDAEAANPVASQKVNGVGRQWCRTTNRAFANPRRPRNQC